MFLVEILRFLSGYVRFTGSGGFSERFINLCTVHSIPLWNISYYDDFFEASTTINGYLKIAVCARNSGVKIKRTRSIGLPFIINRLKPRVGLLIGAVFFIVCFSFLTGKIWVVHISGNKNVPTDTIIAATQKSGLKIGMNASDLSAVQLSLNTCKEVEGISWAAVRINGNCVYIDVTESTDAPEVESTDGVFNLVASKDAQIILSECYRGTSHTKLFSSVMKGDILISGTADNKDETTSFVHASGYIVGKTESTLSTKINTSLRAVNFIPSGKIFTINFFGISIPLGRAPKKHSICFTKTNSLSADGKTLPISIELRQFYTVEQKSKTVPYETVKMMALNDFMNSAATFVKGKQMIESNINFIDNHQSCTVSGNFICFENIGKEVMLETEFDQEN